MDQHRPLITGKTVCNLEQPFEIHPPSYQLVHFGTGVANLHIEIPRPTKWECILQRSLQRTASAHRPPAISHPRDEALLECVCGVNVPGEPPTAAHSGEQLERSLAEAFLEVLHAQLVAMGAQ